MAYAKPQQRKEEESERLRGERDQIKFIDLRFERGQVARFSGKCWGKAYTMPQQRKEAESQRLRGTNEETK